MITIGFEKGARSVLIGVLGQDDQAPILSSPVGAGSSGFRVLIFVMN